MATPTATATDDGGHFTVVTVMSVSVMPASVIYVSVLSCSFSPPSVASVPVPYFSVLSFSIMSFSSSSLFPMRCVPSQSRLLYAPANTDAASQHAPTQIPDGVSASHARPVGGLGGLQSLAGLPHVWQGAVSSVDDMLLISEACNRPHLFRNCSHDLHLYRDVALQDMML